MYLFSPIKKHVSIIMSWEHAVQDVLVITINYFNAQPSSEQRIEIQQADSRAQLEALPGAATAELGIEQNRFGP